MRCVHKAALLGLVLVTLMAQGQASRSSYDPAANRPAKQRESFVDFALKKLNPQDTDYGQKIEEMRQLGILATINDYYYWSNLLAIGVLVIMFCLFFRQDVLLKRRALSVARLVTWYHNELLEARDQAFEQGTKYLQMKRIADEQIEAALAQKPQPAKAELGSSGVPEGPLKSTNGALPHAEAPAEPVLRESIKKLEQQAGRDKETINSLRHQVTVLGRRLQDEQQKNRTLKAV